MAGTEKWVEYEDGVIADPDPQDALEDFPNAETDLPHEPCPDAGDYK